MCACVIGWPILPGSTNDVRPCPIHVFVSRVAGHYYMATVTRSFIMLIHRWQVVLPSDTVAYCNFCIHACLYCPANPKQETVSKNGEGRGSLCTCSGCDESEIPFGLLIIFNRAFLPSLSIVVSTLSFPLRTETPYYHSEIERKECR